MKKIIIILFISLLLVSCNNKPTQDNTGNNTPTQGCDIVDDCGDDDVKASHLNFKEAYEALNGKSNSSGKAHRNISIDENNPFEEVDASEIVKKIENKETFYVYIGDEMCPWCRSVIESAIELAQQANIEKIYYVQIWDDDGNEVVRDQYKYEDGKLNKTVEGIEAYHQLLKYWDSVLEDYTLSDDNDNEIEVGEKRIYAPNFVYVVNGEATRFTTGISSMQEDAREELTAEMIQDTKQQFSEFFGLN